MVAFALHIPRPTWWKRPNAVRRRSLFSTTQHAWLPLTSPLRLIQSIFSCTRASHGYNTLQVVTAGGSLSRHVLHRRLATQCVPQLYTNKSTVTDEKYKPRLWLRRQDVKSHIQNCKLPIDAGVNAAHVPYVCLDHSVWEIVGEIYQSLDAFLLELIRAAPVRQVALLKATQPALRMQVGTGYPRCPLPNPT
jgi:hypothetical protein